MDDVHTMHFEDDGRIPNNPGLPLVLYRGALVTTGNPLKAEACRSLFRHNGWGGIWVNGVFPYHHYHSTAHEVLGVTSGTADIKFGGEHGDIVRLQASDVVIIPAGVGHCNVDSSPDFRVVGAYP
ncbi:MAG: hypothetical protein GYB66_01865, partial [Chloroflexi bacterium]|nr:hypothetical protein [Chloroflexota bacterium]